MRTPDIDNCRQNIEKLLEAIIADIRDDELKRALLRLSDLIDNNRDFLDSGSRILSVTLLQNLRQLEKRVIVQTEPPDVLDRARNALIASTLKLCDNIKDQLPALPRPTLTPPVEVVAPERSTETSK
jgi:hypothetical protein